jgi:hypothetical protein
MQYVKGRIARYLVKPELQHWLRELVKANRHAPAIDERMMGARLVKGKHPLDNARCRERCREREATTKACEPKPVALERLWLFARTKPLERLEQ